jgi:hypothetical protein
MKKINLYVKFQFTSLSPDAQPISIGIVSDDLLNPKSTGEESACIYLFGKERFAKSFYAEFSDFDINRCDDWVKENVVSKLRYYNNAWGDNAFKSIEFDDDSITGRGQTESVKMMLHKWLKQFSDYEIQFIVDCGTFDWYWMLQLIGEWDKQMVFDDTKSNTVGYIPDSFMIRLQKLPPNISPVPQDLNDLIAFKKGISVKKAFELDREEMADTLIEVSDQLEYWGKNGKHFALWDAKVIKAIYEKLM